MKSKILLFLLMLCIAAAVVVGSARATTWLDGHGSGGYFDVDKDDPPTESNLCWLAAASNVLGWSGWGALSSDSSFTGNGNDEDHIFDYLKPIYGNIGGMTDTAWSYWFTAGLDPPDEFDDYYYPITPFLSDYANDDWNDPNYIRQADDRIRDYIGTGYGTVLSMTHVNPPGAQEETRGHAVTIWGYDYDPNTPDQIDIWITDSDRDKDSLDLNMYTMYYGESLLTDPINDPYEYYWHYWYLDYATTPINGHSDAWFVNSIRGLDPYVEPGPGPGPVEPVPEPATILLVGSGLFGLFGIGRKKFKRS